MARYLLTCIVLSALAGNSPACINDVELPQHEREFRSQYQTEVFDSPPPVPPSALRTTGLFVGGGVLLTAAVALTLFGGKARN